jgi:hypothetical protein
VDSASPRGQTVAHHRTERGDERGRDQLHDRHQPGQRDAAFGIGPQQHRDPRDLLVGRERAEGGQQADERPIAGDGEQ